MIKSFNITKVWMKSFETVMDFANTSAYSKPNYEQLLDMNKIHQIWWNVGVMQKSEILYIFKNNSGSSNFSRINHLNPSAYLMGLVSSPTFSATRGFTSTGAGYLATGFAMSAGTLISQNDSAIATYIDTSFNSPELPYGVEETAGANRTLLVPRNGGTQTFAINGATDGTPGNGGAYTLSDSKFYYMIERSGSTTSVLRRNDSGTNTSSNTSSARCTKTIDLLCFKNSAGTRAAFLTSAYMSHFWVGQVLTATQRASFYSLISNYDTIYS